MAERLFKENQTLFVWKEGKEIPGQNFFQNGRLSPGHMLCSVLGALRLFSLQTGNVIMDPRVKRLLPCLFDGLKSSHMFNGVLRRSLSTCNYIKVG